MGTTANTTIIAKLDRLRRCPDFQRRPVRAVVRRSWWRLRWQFFNKPWRLTLPDGTRLLAPQSSTAFLAYLLGHSEPDTAHFIDRFLQEGMSFWDIGANIGEYTILAARRVGPTGGVESLEPNPIAFQFLERNVAANRLENVRLHSLAASNRSGLVSMCLAPDPALSFISHGMSGELSGTIAAVSSVTLDDFSKALGRTPQLIKVDVEGAERLVLQGSGTLLQLPASQAPVWIVEFAQTTCAAFGYSANDLLTRFDSHGYSTYWISEFGHLRQTSAPAPWSSWGNVVAAKRPLL